MIDRTVENDFQYADSSPATLFKPTHRGYPDFFSLNVSYSVNLMWINERSKPENAFIAEDMQFQSIVKCAMKWMEGNPTAKINIWYDGETTSPFQIANSMKHIKQICLNFLNTNLDNLRFEDIRKTKWAKFVRSLQGSPLFFRIDVLRLHITREILNRKDAQYVVYADIDVTPMPKKELFDKKTFTQLDSFGFVVAASAPMFENSFHITANSDSSREAIDAFCWHIDMLMGKMDPQEVDAQEIFNMYPYLITIYLLKTNQYGELRPSFPWRRDFPADIQKQYYYQFLQGIVFEGRRFEISDFTKKIQAPVSRFKLGFY
jgi:hypothetical protein